MLSGRRGKIGMPRLVRGALHLRELLLRSGEAGPKAVDFAEPTAQSGLVDPFFEAGDDALEPFVLIGVRSEHRATDTGMFVLTPGAVGAPAGAELEFALGEVPEELVPLTDALLIVKPRFCVAWCSG